MKKIFFILVLFSLRCFALADEQEWTSGPAPVSHHSGGGILDVLPSESQKKSDEIKEAHNQSPLDILRSDSSVVVQGGGVSGLLPTLFIRGASSDHALMIWNGLEMNDVSAPGAGGDLSFFNREFSHELRVLKGPQSLLYGSSALGGVVIYERDPGVASQVKLAGGSLENSEVLFEKQFQQKDLEFALGGRLVQIRGLSAYDNGNRPLEKDARVEGSFSGMVKWQGPERWRMQALVAHAENRVEDDAPPVDDPNAFTQQKQDSARLNAQYDWSANLQSEFHLSQVQLQRLSLNEADPVSSSTYRDEAKGNLIELHNVNRWHAKEILTQFGFDLRTENADFVTVAKNQSKQALFVLQEFRSNIFDAAYGLRQDCRDNISCETIGQILLQKHIIEWGLSPFMMVATGLKRPTLYQMYSVNSGQSSLSSEHALSLEAGLQWRQQLDKQFQASIFDTIYSDLVDYNTSTSKYYNLNRARIQGAELNYQQMEPWGQWQMGYTSLNPRDEVLGRDLIRRPRQKLSLVTSLRGIEAWTPRIEGAYMSSRGDSSGSSRVDLPEFWIWNAVLAHQLKKSNVSFRVNNFNNVAADFALGYPLPRVNFWCEYQHDLE